MAYFVDVDGAGLDDLPAVLVLVDGEDDEVEVFGEDGDVLDVLDVEGVHCPEEE